MGIIFHKRYNLTASGKNKVQIPQEILKILMKKTTNIQNLQHIFLLSPLSSKVSITACLRNVNNYQV